MKISIVIAEGIKQIMFTPETAHETEALKHIAPNDQYTVASKMAHTTINHLILITTHLCQQEEHLDDLLKKKV